MRSIAFWLKFSVFGFFLVAVLGVLMRYKIAFSFPLLDQKHTQEAHSHFAFYGWITLCIYALMITVFRDVFPKNKVKKYYPLVLLNTIFALLMIPLFLWKGYFVGSIIVSAAALLVSFVFFGFALADFRKVEHCTKPWFIAGLFFAVLSSLGVFSLAYMMSGVPNQNLYLASTYYYLHFQYNGFFLFSCIGLLMNTFEKYGAKISSRENKQIFWLMFLGCIIGYGLSVLWLKLPLWIFIVIVIGTLMQTFGAVKIYQLIKRNWFVLMDKTTPLQRFVLLYVGFAFFVKILLQLGSNIPVVAQFAFGFRNVVVAYLHLILLMCISVFLLSQVVTSGFFKPSKLVNTSFVMLLVGIFLNELILGLMGVFSIKYISIPHSAVMLVVVSVVMMLSIFLFWLGLQPNKSASK